MTVFATAFQAPGRACVVTGGPRIVWTPALLKGLIFAPAGRDDANAHAERRQALSLIRSDRRAETRCGDLPGAPCARGFIESAVVDDASA
jgi:hypothetical protein